MEYVHRFGVDHLIPKYDHLSFVAYHNLDLLAIVLTIIFIIYSSVTFCILKVYRGIFKPKDRIKDENRLKKREKKQKDD